MASVELQILQDLASAGVLAVGSAITYVTTKIVPKYIHSKTVQNAIANLGSIVEATVSDFNQKVVDSAKKEGTFTDALAQSVKADALAAVKDQGAPLIKLLEGSIGNLDSFLSSLIEQSVASNKTIVSSVAIAQPVQQPTA